MARQKRTDGEIRAGRTGPSWTDVQDWVALSGVDNQAVLVYLLLRMHERAGLTVDTPRLAAMMRLGRADAVGPLVRQLRTIGAVTVARQGRYGCNVYRTHDEPPDDYAGPVTLAEYHERAALAGAGGTAVVYYLRRADGAVKIGYTADLATRVRRLARDYAGLTLLGFESGTSASEGRAHDRFHKARIFGDGEWFHPVPELMAHIASLAPAARGAA